MGIKWDNIHPAVSRENEILLCKGKKVFKNGKLLLVGKDKSEDKTQEVMDAAIQYLLNLVQRSCGPERKAIIEREGMYRLTFEDLREEIT